VYVCEYVCDISRTGHVVPRRWTLGVVGVLSMYCCLCVVYVLSMCCLCVVCVLSVCCLCVVCVLSVCCLSNVYVCICMCRNRRGDHRTRVISFYLSCNTELEKEKSTLCKYHLSYNAKLPIFVCDPKLKE